MEALGQGQPVVHAGSSENEGSTGRGTSNSTSTFQNKIGAMVKVVAPHSGSSGKTTPYSFTPIFFPLRARLPNYMVGYLVAQFQAPQSK